TPGDPALSGFPEEARIGMFGKLVQADVAAIDGHGLRVGRKGDNARAVVELDDTDFHVFSERGRASMLVGPVDLDVFLAMAGDGMGQIKNFGKGVALTNVFDRAGILF